MRDFSQMHDIHGLERKRPPYPKRGLDLVAGLLLLPLWLPLLALLALACLVAQGRPVFFVQRRPGLLGRPFSLYKLRTMRSSPGDGHADEPVGSPEAEAARTTRLGRLLRVTHLDELPGFVNVLRGDMSLVGPRPLLMEYLPLYDGRQMRRHAVRPGLTGLAQICGGNALSWELNFALDVAYVENLSFELDMEILRHTFLMLFRRDAAAPSHRAPFRGNRRQET
jgi:sugar transferase EpsL